MKSLILAALLLVSTAAFATNNNEGGCRGNCGSSGQPVDVEQHQAQHQGQAQHQAQQANASAGAVAGASNTTVVGVGVDASSSNTNLNVANGGQGGRGGDGGIGFGGSARAEGGDSYSHGGVQGQQQGIADSGNSSNSNINSNRNDSTAINEGNNSAQSTSLNFEASEIPQHTPDATAPGIFSSHACTLSGGLGLAAPGYGVSVGGTKIDPACSARENARILAGLDSSLSILYLCKNIHLDIGETLGDLCHPNAPEPPVVVPEPEQPEPETPVVYDQING